jgi:hypothetical protein
LLSELVEVEFVKDEERANPRPVFYYGRKGRDTNCPACKRLMVEIAIERM